VKTSGQTEVVRRLHCAAGHLNAVIKMAEDGQPCEKVLHQLNAVERALHAASVRHIRWHIRQSEATILASPSSLQAAAELKRLPSLYAILTHKHHQLREVSE